LTTSERQTIEKDRGIVNNSPGVLKS